MEISVYTDGGSRGNPGPSGFGLVVYDEQRRIIYQQSTFLGTKTNNEAEYSGLIAALKWITDNQKNLDIQQITFYSDSELLVRQLTGIYKVKSPHIKPLYVSAQNFLQQINLPYKFCHLYRESNSLADELANQAMDQHVKS